MTHTLQSSSCVSQSQKFNVASLALCWPLQRLHGVKKFVVTTKDGNQDAEQLIALAPF